METSNDPPAGQGTPPQAALEYHPAAALFPLLPVDSQEFGELVEDIREHGLIQPIVLHEGKVLDTQPVSRRPARGRGAALRGVER